MSLVVVEVFGKPEGILCRGKGFSLYMLVDMACPVGGYGIAFVNGACGYLIALDSFFYFRRHDFHWAEVLCCG